MSHSKLPLYWDWVESESALIDSDGCSSATGAYLKCCLVHDLSYYYAADPVDAYKHYIAGADDCWELARPIRQADADANFRRCIQAHSKLGILSPMAIWRWGALKMFGKKAWNNHRQMDVD